jgi:putative transposase
MAGLPVTFVVQPFGRPTHTSVIGVLRRPVESAQYTSTEFRERLKKPKIRPSVGRTGVCWDNAMAESFNGALKNGLVYRTVYPTRNRARQSIAQYIELFYNRQRLHSGLGYMTPHEVHTEYLNRQVAA